MPRQRAGFTLIELVIIILVIVVLVTLLVRTISVTPRFYHEGRNEREWMELLNDADPDNDAVAAAALSHLLLEERSHHRREMVQTLNRAGPRAKEATPALEEILRRERDRGLWDDVRLALARIDPGQAGE